MALLSKSCEYALRAVIYIAGGQKDREYVSIREVSEELKLSFHFLTKILQKLTEGGLLVSYRGPKGGVALARPAAQISVLDVLNAMDEGRMFKECILGLNGCSDASPCPLHEAWAKHRKALSTMLDERSLSSLSGLVVGGRRLVDLGT